MLYLNACNFCNKNRKTRFNFNKCCIWIFYNPLKKYHILNLTLTSVVFESSNCKGKSKNGSNLTLTSVVFEFSKPLVINKVVGTFNFNKCCIWMWQSTPTNHDRCHLTLTSVVFELNMVMFYIAPPLYLTLTSVVFEFVLFLTRIIC